MRSIRTAKEGDKDRKEYYTEDKSLGKGEGSSQKTYYGKGEAKSLSEAMTEAVWFGKDAERLNLVGHAQQSDFEQIYDGYIPGTNERIRGHKPREDHKENCLYDLVLSCKKSVSMQIHLGKDDRLYKAYQETVLEVAKLIEEDYAQAKIQVNGERNVVQTEGIIALLMPHHTTRELDMGVHTHLLIANGTYCKDGKWRSLRDVGFSHAYYMGDYFSARLAARVQALGYEIRETVTEQGHPSWELAGYTDEQIKVFSKRSENVEVKELIAAGYSRDDALLVTRKAKDLDETIEQMQERWSTEAQEHGIEAVVPLEHPVTPKRQATAQEVLESAIRHYSHNSVHFSRDQIREYAFKLNRPFDVAQLDQAIANHPELIDYAGIVRGKLPPDNSLGKIGKLEDFQGHFTTAKAFEREIRTIKAWMEGQGKATVVMDRETSAQALEEIRLQPGAQELKSGQRAAVIGVLASHNLHQVIHGLSGVGKTTALRQLKALMDRQGVEVLGLAPSIPAAQKLGEEMGIQTQTVQKFIRNELELKPGQFLVIDEFGMGSADMLDVVLEKANAVGARVLLVGDTGQNQSIEAGSPMRSVMAHGAETHHIAEIIRQQDDIQRQAVELIAKGNGLDALSLLSEHDYVSQIEDREQRVSAIASEYLGLSVAEQAETLIVTGTNAEKDAITTEIRAGLKANGLLGESVKVTGLEGQKLKLETAKAIETYEVGQELTLKRKLEKTVTTKPDVYRVMAVEGDEVVLLRTATDTLYRFNPQHQKFVTAVNVTQLRDRALSPEETREVLFYRVGDYLSLSRNYKTTGLVKDTPYQVVGKEGDELMVSSVGGRLYRFNPKHYRDKKVFSAHDFEIAVGDTLRWTTTNRDKGQINGHTVEIAALNGHVATAFTQKGERIEIDLSRPLPVDYTLCSTSYRAQGSDRLRVLYSATNDPTSNREPFYVGISRQIKFLKVWTDNYERLKGRVAESSVQRNPIELLFGESYGSSPVSGDNATAQAAIEPDAGATAAESGNAVTAQQHHEHHPDHHSGRDGLIPDGVRGATGEPEAVRDSGRDSGIDGDIEGVEGPTDELGTDTRRHDLPGELRDGGNQELRSEVAQQQLAQSAAELRSRMERVISSLTVLGSDELVHDSGIVEGTREVVEALEPIVSSLEGQPVAPPPKRDLSAAMARVINGLTAVDSEKVFGESEIIAEIKSLVSRVEAHAIAQAQLTKLGETYVHQNSSSESPTTTARRDEGIDTHARNTRITADGTNSRTERHSADFEPAPRGSTRAIVSDRNAGIEGYDPALTGGYRGADQSPAQASRNQERDLSAHQAESRTRPRTSQNHQVKHRDAGTQPATARNDRRGFARADQRNGPEQTGTLATSLFNRATDGLSARADAIVRIRLQRELAEPLAQLRATLAQIREVNQLNEQLKATFAERQSWIVAQQAELAAERKSIAAQKEALLAQMEAQLAQAKIEVLDTTLTEWRSLRQEPELLQIPELAVAPSEVAELISLIENYPAQKVIEYAMAEYYQATEQDIETKSTLKAVTPGFRVEQQSNRESRTDDSLNRVPKPRTNSPPKPKPSTAAPGQTSAKPKVRTQRPPIPKPVKPAPIVAFWQPDYAEAQKPNLLEPHHWEEFQRSGIHPDLISLNIESVSGQEVYERLLSERLAQLGTGQYVTQPMARLMAQYEQVAEGGWWGTAGIDAKSLLTLDPGQQPQPSTWGVFKADNPRIDPEKTERKGEIEYIKYENPLGVNRSLYLPIVPDALAQQIYVKHGIEPTDAEQQSGFWSVVANHPEIPIVVTEGLKKTLSSLSQGEVTIGLAGVNALYRARDDDKEKLPERVLNDEMAIFAAPGRSFTFAFDSDSKTSTVFNVRAELVRGVELLEVRDTAVKVAKWKPELGKGLDDLITEQGPTVYAVALAKAEAAEREKRIYYRTQYNALAREVRKNKPSISGEALDIEVYLLAITKGESKDGERFLSQSDHARSLKDPAQVAAYIEHIKTAAPQYAQQQELEAAQAAAQAETQRQRELEAAKAAAQAQRQKELAAAQAAAQAKALAQQQPAIDRANYEKLAQQVRNQLIDTKPQQFDAIVYKWAQARGLDPERTLAQSNTARTFKHPAQLSGYLRQLNKLANRLNLDPGPNVSDQQRRLNERALMSCIWLTKNYGKQQPDGWTVFEGDQFSYHAKDGKYKIYSRTEGRTVLERGDDRLVSTLSPKDVKKLESAVEKGKVMIEQNKKKAQEEIQEKKRNRKSRGRKPKI